MAKHDSVFSLLVEKYQTKSLSKLSRQLEVTAEQLAYIRDERKFPQGDLLRKVLKALDISELCLRLQVGSIDKKTSNIIAANALGICDLVDTNNDSYAVKETQAPVYKTELGSLYNIDCVDFLKSIPDNSVDLVFADPPFNLNKDYPSKIKDDLKESHYLEWCESWINECSRILKMGGALFLWNIPKWNSILSNFLNEHLSFRHWIATEMAYRLPIQNRLYPGHYSLLYYIKGSKPNRFHPDRLKMKICRTCKNEIKDYGGYKSKMNPKGINLSDVWTDISPVRHKKYKRRNGANELPIKLLDRIIELASDPDDTIVDPFGGAGTTYVAAELKGRKWLGTEIGPVDDILNRFQMLDEEKEHLTSVRSDINALFPEKDKKERLKRGLWICENFE